MNKLKGKVEVELVHIGEDYGTIKIAGVESEVSLFVASLLYQVLTGKALV